MISNRREDFLWVSLSSCLPRRALIFAPKPITSLEWAEYVQFKSQFWMSEAVVKSAAAIEKRLLGMEETYAEYEWIGLHPLHPDNDERQTKISS